MPLLSIIIPVFNSRPYLEACINSVVSHREVDIEFILVDDGSTDGSECIADSAAKRDSRVRVYHQKNSGVSVARNYGISVAKGKYLYFLDSDDLCMVDDFSFLRSSKDLFLGRYATGDESGYKMVPSDLSAGDPLALYFLKGVASIHISSVIVARNIVSDWNVSFPEKIKYGEDQEFILKVLTHSRDVEFYDRLFAIYRTNLSSAMYKLTLSKFDVVISRINLLEYFEKTDKITYDFLREYAVLESVRSVCEGLMRHGMPFSDVSQFLRSNSEIRDYYKKYSDTVANDDMRLLTSGMALRKLQFDVLYGKMIYNIRRKASIMKSDFLRRIQRQNEK